MITVACVFWGTKFSDQYVYNLQAMVRRNTTEPHRFVCLSDRELPGVETVRLSGERTGWWCKLEMFNPAMDLGDRVVYLDLDTVITGNIDWLLQYNGNMMGIEDLGATNAHQKHLKGVFQSGILAFDRVAMAGLWDHYTQNEQRIIQSFRGDGEYMHAVLGRGADLLQNLHPGRIGSYKYDVYPTGKAPHKDISIVCFHGRPSVVQATAAVIDTPARRYKPQSWVKHHWHNRGSLT